MYDPRTGAEVPSETVDVAQYGVLREQTVETVKYLTDSGDMLEEMEHYLAGEDWDEASQRWVQVRDAVMNERGRRMLIGFFMQPYYGKIYTLSNYSDKEIAQHSFNYGLDLLEYLYWNHREFEIEKGSLRVLVNGLTRHYNATLKKAKDGGFLNFLKDTHRSVETRRVGNQGMMQKLSGGLK